MIPVNEAAFTAQVIDLAHVYGWLAAHFRPCLSQSGRWLTAVQGDGVGFPDLVLCRGERLIFAELKSARGKTTLAQDAWLAVLRTTGAETALWRPGDIAVIQETLAGGETAHSAS